MILILLLWLFLGWLISGRVVQYDEEREGFDKWRDYLGARVVLSFAGPLLPWLDLRLLPDWQDDGKTRHDD